MPATPTRSDRRRERTRAQLTSAARELITRKGVAGLRIGDITETADVGRGSFYNHFATKDDLVAAVVEQIIGEIAEGALRTSGEQADPALRACVADQRFVRIAYDDPDTARLVVNLAHADTVFERAVRPYARGVVEAGRASGRFAISDVEMALIVLTSSALAVMRSILDGSAPPDAHVLHSESMLLVFGVLADEAHAVSRAAARS